MKFRTNITLSKERNLIDYDSELLLIGSCFSETIFEKLDYFKFPSSKNPFGIVYNPLAIENFILNAINAKEYTSNDIFELNERWHCFDAHSDLSNPDNLRLIAQLNKRIKNTHTALKSTSHIIITLGTAWTYRFIENDKIVANCHKVPQKKFLKELCSAEEIASSLNAIIVLIKSVNPTVNIVFNISPIRHLKDGFVENSISKAHLRTGIHEVVDVKNKIYYFPSFEIMMDDLRDYRFYKQDMLHPNDTAINYIWEQFQQTWIAPSTSGLMHEISVIQKGLAHRPFHPDSEKHKRFKDNLQSKIDKLQSEYNIIF